jgi:hypothetical protein
MAATEGMAPDRVAEAVRTRIVQRLCGAGVPRVDVQAGIDEDGADGHGGFAIRTGYGGVKLYLPDAVLRGYAREDDARRAVDAAITGILELLRRP